MDHFAVRDTDDAVKFTVAGSSVSFVALPDGFCLHIHMAQDAAYTVNGVGLPVIDPVQSGVWVKFQGGFIVGYGCYFLSDILFPP